MAFTLQMRKLQHGEMIRLASQLRDDLSPVCQPPTQRQGALPLTGSAWMQAGVMC